MATELARDAELWRSLLALVMAALAVMGSPGPSTVSVTAVGAAYGFRRSVPYMSGLVAGTIAVLLAVAAGFVALLLSMPRLLPLLVAASVAYILYLAFRIATAPPLARQERDAPAPSFAGGFLLGVANPKAYLAIAAVFAGASLAAQAPIVDAAAKIVVLSAMIVFIHVFWLAIGVSLAALFYDPVTSRRTNIVLALLLVATLVVGLLP
ncbi:threonine transporter RhtB [Mesorhizobium sp. L-8-10]|uniref:LysE family translocator n=1 Tax=unclassified Mesorhizobium TaxID=325217 RepID=UPI001927BD32|nr:MULTISPECIES: LysE family transporter [unclassified Mesorhizobium]BCH23875.1 threonine transporter RhtB [Mesorhizobium sp. L-8-3]BCH31610.1 threonine transporter RhtB [Mesorhizobium sp. L-8-10]